jgi:molybdate transport system substrate-binding protein
MYIRKNLTTNLTRRHRRVVCLFSILLFSLGLLASCRDSSQQTATTEIHVAAASDLTTAFGEIGREFEKAQAIKVLFSFGASGVLARQIENGSPMDVFAAANVGYVDQLERQNLIIPDTKAIYARGRITLWTPKDSQIKLTQISDLTQSDVKRIAIANPEYAPYGMAAREVMQAAGVWASVKSKLVYGENIRQTFQFAETGNVDVAIIALSLSKESDGKWTLIGSELHKPLDQAMTVIKATKNERAAREFCKFVNGTAGRSILRKYGFEFPDEK